MLVLVATKTGQGKRKNDFCFVDEGELVHFCFECDGETVDGSCGCRRSLSGATSHKATTTFTVVEKEISPEEYRRVIHQSYLDAGWKDLNTKETYLEADELAKMATHFGVGALLEKRGTTIQTRHIKRKTEKVVIK